ncbi:MAG: hypothetical protein ABI318_19255 [Chthoniobacteraceae bacterium]
MKTSALRLLLLLAVLTLAACSDPRSTSLSRLRHANAAELRASVAQLYTRLFPAPGPTVVPVRPDVWPAALMKLHPLRMNLYRDGLAITLQAGPGMEYGLHILATGDAQQPKSTARTQYEKLQDGIFYFSQKR